MWCCWRFDTGDDGGDDGEDDGENSDDEGDDEEEKCANIGRTNGNLRSSKGYWRTMDQDCPWPTTPSTMPNEP